MSKIIHYVSLPAGRALLMRYISAFFLIGGMIATGLFLAAYVAR